MKIIVTISEVPILRLCDELVATRTLAYIKHLQPRPLDRLLPLEIDAALWFEVLTRMAVWFSSEGACSITIGLRAMVALTATATSRLYVATNQPEIGCFQIFIEHNWCWVDLRTNWVTCVYRSMFEWNNSFKWPIWLDLNFKGLFVTFKRWKVEFKQFGIVNAGSAHIS